MLDGPPNHQDDVCAEWAGERLADNLQSCSVDLLWNRPWQEMTLKNHPAAAQRLRRAYVRPAGQE